MKRSALLITWLGIVLAGCSTDTSTEASGALSVPAPLTHDGASKDVSDRGCLVVLQDVARELGQAGYEVDCSSGHCWFVWSGVIRVARNLVEEGATVGLMYQSGMGDWWEVAAEAMGDGDGPMQSFSFRMFEHTVDSGTSMTSLTQSRIPLIAVVHLPGGGRLFDHNRMPGDLDNYVLDSSNDWSVQEEFSVCASGSTTASTIEFFQGWEHEQHGAIVGGGSLRIDYDIERLSDCRGTHNGYPAWDTTAFARFLPMDVTLQASVRAFESNYGTPTTKAYSVPAIFDVPLGAERVELWFRNASGAGMSCETWDSNLEANYVFSVESSAPAPVKWAGDWGQGFTRECEHRDGLEEPTAIDSWTIQRACLFVDADVYVPGLTDVDGDVSRVFAQVEYGFDDGQSEVSWLSYEGRVGNNYRYRWTLPRERLQQTSWERISYRFGFSTDGLTWYWIGQGEGPDGQARTLVRDF